ncbi:hypothetical protein [Mycobacterium sp. 852014-52144_SCH5372336]|uniref:hypothetical protein n=1 Tax=Mycobacterium sp. 852014-52144_SCH5372336 TaxID=1834115 RepID=UPI000A68B8B5
MGDRMTPPRWLKYANKLVMVLLRLGLPISRHESPVVLTVPGRRTGKPRSTPITPMFVDGARYVINGWRGLGIGDRDTRRARGDGGPPAGVPRRSDHVAFAPCLTFACRGG